MTPSTPLSDSPPTPLPTGWWTLPPLPVEPPTPPPVVVRPTPPPTTDWWTQTSVPLPTQPPVVGPPPTLPPQTIEEIFQGIFNSSEEVFTTSQVNDDPYEYDYDDADALNNNNKPTSQNNGWSSSTDDGWSSSTSHSSSTAHVVMGKSSKSSTSSKSSKSGQGLIEGKSDKDDSSLMRLEQMRYKVNGGRGRGGGSIEMLLFMVTAMTVLSYLVW